MIQSLSYRLLSNAGQIRCADEYVPGFLAQASARAAWTVRYPHKFLQVLSHHGRFGFMKASGHVRQNTLRSDECV